MERFPRPRFTTNIALSYQRTKSKRYKEELFSIIIREYIKGNFSYAGQDMDIHTFSKTTSIPMDTVVTMIKHEFSNPLAINEVYGKDKTLAAEEQFKVMLTIAGQNAMSDRNLILSQVKLLMEAQGGKYVPFLSDSTLRALDTLLKANKNLVEVVRTSTGGGGINVNILNQQNQQSNQNYLTPESAVQLLESKLGLNSPEFTQATAVPEHVDRAIEFSLVQPEAIPELQQEIAFCPHIIADTVKRTDGNAIQSGKPDETFIKALDYTEVEILPPDTHGALLA